MARFKRNQIGMRKADFKRVFSRNQKSSDALLLVLARPNGLRTSRLGLAIARKHTPKAVDRNRIKRLVRESFMHNQPFRVAVDAVVMDRRGTALKSNKELFQSLSKHWQTIIKKLEHQGI